MKLFAYILKLEILQSLGGLYDGLAFYGSTPSTGLRRLQFRSLSLPPEFPPPLIDIHLRTL